MTVLSLYHCQVLSYFSVFTLWRCIIWHIYSYIISSVSSDTTIIPIAVKYQMYHLTQHSSQWNITFHLTTFIPVKYHISSDTTFFLVKYHISFDTTFILVKCHMFHLKYHPSEISCASSDRLASFTNNENKTSSHFLTNHKVLMCFLTVSIYYQIIISVCKMYSILWGRQLKESTSFNSKPLFLSSTL